MKIIKQVIDSLTRSPVKSVLTIATVGLGVGVLILVLSMTSAIRENMERQLAEEGYVLMVANSALSDEGRAEPVRPPQFDASVIQTLHTDVEAVVAVTPVQAPNWQDFLASDRQYRVRSAVAASEEYVGVMELELVAGSYFTASDVSEGNRYAVVTSGLATALFGSPEEALGKSLSVPTLFVTAQGAGGGGGSGQGRAFGGDNFRAPSFEIYGVVEDPTELMRKAYGIGDLIVPFTAILPAGFNQRIRIDFFYATLAVRVQGVDIQTATAQIRDSLARSYGEEVSVMVWEGTMAGESSYLADLRSTIATFSLVGNILGFVLLAVASIGIMSIMLVEAIGKSRDISLERALGASNRRIMGEYFSRSVIISLISGVVGVIFSVILSHPLSALIAPVFEGFTGLGVDGSVLTLTAVLTAFAAAAGLGGIFGTLPLFSVLRTPISEGLRDV